MKTKYFVKFLNKSAHLDADLELVDVIKSAVKKNRLNSPGTKLLFDDADKTRHKKLSARRNSDHSRNIAANHLAGTIREAFIKSMYEATTNYFQDILKAATKKGLDTDRLIGEHLITFTSKELIALGNFSKIVDRISSQIFRQLENEKNTKSLIIKMSKKLGLKIPENVIDKALPYLEMRHLLVHSEGKADKDFCKNYPTVHARDGKDLNLGYEMITQAKETITMLIETFDNAIVAAGHIEKSEIQP
ncbi:hypothetical protein [Chitinophaga sp. MM2321]|uniref:hypothetical protein n=1 Tax=Chitinophaga sp. MM2321 TaxID=3137178 RepID=UPI0032D5A1BF